LYLGDYAKMADNPDYPDDGAPDDATEFTQTIQNNASHPNEHMKIDVTYQSGSTYSIAIYLDNNPAPSYSDILVLGAIDVLNLQAHWGSGVIFSNMQITKK